MIDKPTVLHSLLCIWSALRFYIATTRVSKHQGPYASHAGTVRAFARVKRVVDKHRWRFFGHCLEPLRYKPKSEDFVRTLLPILSCYAAIARDRTLVWAHPGQVVGYDEVHITGNGVPHNEERRVDPSGFCDSLDDRTCRDTTGAARGYKAEGLDLYWLYEGASRPSLYASVGRQIPIQINRERFPDFENTQIIAVR